MSIVCNMMGDNWGSMLYLIIIDSRACASIAFADWRKHVEVKEADASQRGAHYTAANGHNMYNQGKGFVAIMLSEDIQKSMRFQVCGMERPLGSVLSIRMIGLAAISNPLEDPRVCYIEHR